MTERKEGLFHAPQGKPQPVVKKGEFVFAAHSLDHNHIYGITNGLIEAGGTLKAVYDPQPERAQEFVARYGSDVQIVRHEDDLFNDPDIHMIASAGIPCDRGPLGVRVMQAGKDYFVDKGPFTTLDQLDAARQTVSETGRKYMVYYSERLHVESAVYAGQLIAEGAIGRVVNVIGMGPHRLSEHLRPDWFFQKDKYGGILTDIGSHQIEQYLAFSGATDAEVRSSTVGNVNNPQNPGLEDFGEVMLTGNNGSTNYFRIDWLTPNGLPTWGDGRTFIQGTGGYIELRKYVDLAHNNETDRLYLVNDDGAESMSLAGKVGFPFFGQLILDCLNRTENAMTQAHAFKAAELCMKAQAAAKIL